MRIFLNILSVLFVILGFLCLLGNDFRTGGLLFVTGFLSLVILTVTRK